MKKIFLFFLAVVCLQVQAWTPPDTVNVIVGQGPGGGNEFAFRALQKQIEQRYPETKFIIEYRPGLDSVISMNYFGNLAPDGRNLYMVLPVTGFVTAPLVHASQLKTDPKTFKPITGIATSPMAIVVPFDSPIQNTKDFIDFISNNNSNIAISGAINLLTFSYIQNRLKIPSNRMQSVNFKSPLDATVAVASKSVNAAIVPLSLPKSLIESKKIKIIGHTGTQPIAGLENVDIISSVIPGLEMQATWSLFLPPRTPDHIVKYYERLFVPVIQQEDVKKYFSDNWAMVDQKFIGSDRLTLHILSTMSTWRPIASKILKAE